MILNLTDREYYRLMRKRYNIKLKAISDYIGCSLSLLSKYEKGQRELSKDKLKLYIKFINDFIKSI
ncbi:helix-turn-helix domain-containing protein [Clostridium omnivorum]|uniref:HTH cro/C1-type domain-containing protein n=1 Tax=Clostridium omnivorum TaxID=1604902 RepID=A0ABQ5NAG1_9CLOT|nr:helix-turn-helix transcriptional regulator [Clostridium sp. E14]GLC32179.1 hypothetical protein bsdE14_35890 [Clostridium sp. E14]